MWRAITGITGILAIVFLGALFPFFLVRDRQVNAAIRKQYAAINATTINVTVTKTPCGGFCPPCSGVVMCGPCVQPVPFTGHVALRYRVNVTRYVFGTDGSCGNTAQQALNQTRQRFPSNAPIPAFYKRSDPARGLVFFIPEAGINSLWAVLCMVTGLFLLFAMSYGIYEVATKRRRAAAIERRRVLGIYIDEQ